MLTDRKLCNNKFTWCFHKAKQVYCIHHANVQETYKSSNSQKNFLKKPSNYHGRRIRLENLQQQLNEIIDIEINACIANTFCIASNHAI